MKVLHVIDSSGIYGAEVMLLTLMEEQRKHGMHVVLASIGVKGEQEKQIEQEARQRNLQVSAFRMHKGPDPLGACRLLCFVRRGSFDIIHCHGYKPDILLGFIPRRIRKVPVVATLHGWTNMRRLSRMSIYEWLDLASLRFLDQVIAVNRSVLRRGKIGRDGRIRAAVVNNGIPAKTGGTGALAKNDPIGLFCGSNFTIGSIGRLSGEKGYRYLIEAIGNMRRSGTDVRLVIIGEGAERESLTRMVRQLDLEPWVLLPGYREKASAYMSRFDVFVLSSLTEGLPVTLLEAMRAGVPVVATAVGGIPEVLRRSGAGLMVDSADSRGLAEKLSRLYHDPELRAELGRRGKDAIYGCYSSEIMERQYREIYSGVLERKAVRGESAMIHRPCPTVPERVTQS
jgi:glycosyltransferase involved in cell wall biosynthesis